MAAIISAWQAVINSTPFWVGWLLALSFWCVMLLLLLLRAKAERAAARVRVRQAVGWCLVIGVVMLGGVLPLIAARIPAPASFVAQLADDVALIRETCESESVRVNFPLVASAVCDGSVSQIESCTELSHQVKRLASVLDAKRPVLSLVDTIRTEQLLSACRQDLIRLRALNRLQFYADQDKAKLQDSVDTVLNWIEAMRDWKTQKRSDDFGFLKERPATEIGAAFGLYAFSLDDSFDLTMDDGCGGFASGHVCARLVMEAPSADVATKVARQVRERLGASSDNGNSSAGRFWVRTEGSTVSFFVL